ncbi:MAG: hypothetical protein ACSLFP_18470 [Acidimicrobiales bacterium]
MPQDPEGHDEVLAHVGTDRRQFVKRLIVGSAFATPVVSSFSMSGVNSVFAQDTNVSGQDPDDDVSGSDSENTDGSDGEADGGTTDDGTTDDGGTGNTDDGGTGNTDDGGTGNVTIDDGGTGNTIN